MTLLLLLGVPLLVLLSGTAFSYLYAWTIERRFPPTGRFIEVEGCRIHYREESPEGIPPRGTIVILHGASSNLVESMLGMGAALSQRYRVIAIDRPGHGWSERKAGLGEAKPARQAALVADALRKLNVRNAVVDSRAGWLWFRTLAVPILLVLRPLMKKKTFWPQQPPEGIVTKGFIPLAFRPRAYEVNMQDFAVMYDGVLKQSGRYRDIRLPTLVIAGDEDEIVWTDLHSRCFAREVPGAELILMPGIGHMPQYADQETVLSAIETLAARVVAPAREDVDHA
jgi:pimeloyl-ACP methyl ester carboxylesterase